MGDYPINYSNLYCYFHKYSIKICVFIMFSLKGQKQLMSNQIENGNVFLRMMRQIITDTKKEDNIKEGIEIIRQKNVRHPVGQK